MIASNDELDSGDLALIERARSAMGHAYAPYSKFPVGAALRLKSGEVVIGNNQENASYPNGLCAERVAMFAAASSRPEDAFETLAIVSQAAGPVCPCGICRQTMLEYADRFGKSFRLILSGASDEVILIEDTSKLLPLGFASTSLKT